MKFAILLLFATVALISASPDPDPSELSDEVVSDEVLSDDVPADELLDGVAFDEVVVAPGSGEKS